MKIITRKKLVFSVAIVLIICWLFKSNSIIVNLFSNQFIPQETQDINLENSLVTDATIEFDYIRPLNNLLEDFLLEGWVALYDDNIRYPSSIQMLLVSSDTTYQVNSYITQKISVQNNIDNQNDHGIAYSFQSIFPTVSLKKGIYRLYLLYEYDIGKYYVNTGKVFEKKPEKFQQYFAPEESLHPEDTRTVYGGIENVNDTDGDMIEVNGWAALENGNSYIESVHIEVEVDNSLHYYPAEKRYRRDVGTYFMDTRYSYSGYTAYIPKALVEDKNAKLRVVVDEYRAGNVYQLDQNGKLYIHN